MEEIAVLGVGMHSWGKWGRNFVDYGVHAAREALDDAGVDWRDVGFVSGAITVRCGYPGYVAGSTFARALGFTGAQVASSYAACASGATALSVARGQILSGIGHHAESNFGPARDRTTTIAHDKGPHRFDGIQIGHTPHRI